MLPLTKIELIQDLTNACKAPEAFKIGAEHEVFLFKDNKRLTYSEILEIFKFFMEHGWQPYLEGETIIGLSNKESRANITLEPGGQFELSGSPHTNLHDLTQETQSFWDTLDAYSAQNGITLYYKGFDDITGYGEIPWMQKKRYDIMREYMPKRGNLGHFMMQRTCTVQGNLDFESEADMALKFRVSMAIQPIITALFANSPFTDNQGNTYESFRAAIWQDTDPHRTGILPMAFEPDFGFERYVDYALSVPMYFIHRDGHYINAAGAFFQDFMDGKLAYISDSPATIKDWHDHLTIAFPEVRLKHYLEMRGADCGDRPMILALQALWVGLLYDRETLSTLASTVMEWSYEEIVELYRAVPKQGIAANFKGKTCSQWAAWLIELAQRGLERRNIPQNPLEINSPNESIYLRALFEKMNDNYL